MADYFDRRENETEAERWDRLFRLGQQLEQDRRLYGAAYVTRDGRRIDPRDVKPSASA